MNTATAAANELARFMSTYAKGYAAGAFATPTAAELARPGTVRQWRRGEHRVVAVTKTLTRPTTRTDFTGTPYTLPAGTRLITHLARTPGAPLPDLTAWHLVYCYREDQELCEALRAQGRVVRAINVTAASEIIACYRHGSAPHLYPPHDQATVTRMALRVPPQLARAALAEVAAVDAWHDDFPYYSDGSWAAVSLRGFVPEDPRWGIKPAEMGRKWQQAHPEAMHYRCDWTVLAARTPALRQIIDRVDWWGGLERVRLLRMSGRGGRGGKLGRHTDITDRAAGTRDGQIARFHIPLITDPQIMMHTWDLTGTLTRTHLEPLGLYYLDARKPHAVVNPTGVDRVHLVADVVCDAAVRAHITAAHTGGKHP